MRTKFARPSIQAICFDFDGTVADTMPFLTDLAVAILTDSYGMAAAEARTRYIATTGLPFKDQLEIIVPGDPRNNRAATIFEEKKALNYTELLPIAHASETFHYLRDAGYRLIVSSSTTENLIDRFLAKHHITCDLALGDSDSRKKGKGHFNFISNLFTIDFSSLCYIGDSLNDYKMATENDVRFIAKCGIFNASDFYAMDRNILAVDDLLELTAIFS
jgi:HAD superfamily hydrolase (TIGR01549 family)